MSNKEIISSEETKSSKENINELNDEDKKKKISKGKKYKQ